MEDFPSASSEIYIHLTGYFKPRLADPNIANIDPATTTLSRRPYQLVVHHPRGLLSI